MAEDFKVDIADLCKLVGELSIKNLALTKALEAALNNKVTQFPREANAQEEKS